MVKGHMNNIAWTRGGEWKTSIWGSNFYCCGEKKSGCTEEIIKELTEITSVIQAALQTNNTLPADNTNDVIMQREYH
ncbi:unnamed protein product [Caretta caretta]